MKFLVTWKVFETITQAQFSPQRVNVPQGVQQMLESPKVKDAGFFTDARGAYLVLDGVTSADEILELLGPEILDNCYVESHPIASAERVGELFGQWAEQGR
jgi:hypothetical protein